MQIQGTNQNKENLKGLLSLIDELKSKVDKSNLEIVEKLEEAIRNQKYGIVFENHREEIDNIDGKPFLVEIKEKEINKGQGENLLIEGDNYHSLILLKERYKEKTDVIYIDPPYNTGNKGFRYGDKFFSPEDDFAHSKWLSFMNRRLLVAKELMTETGVIFISIDDREYAVLKVLCDEIFGEKNHLGTIIQSKGNAQNDAKNIQRNHEYILVYSKGKRLEGTKELPLLITKTAEKKKVEKDKEGRFFYKGSAIVNGVVERVFKNPIKGCFWQSTYEKRG